MLKSLKTLTILLLLLPQLAIPAALPVQSPVIPLPINPALLDQIQTNHPELETEYALTLAHLFHRYSEKYHLDSRRIAAIAMQESGYEPDAKHCYKLQGRIHCDYCMMQINDRTIKRYGFDQERLLHSVSYCVEAGTIILADFKRMYGKKDKYYWTRYNAQDPEMREIYKKLVNRWM